jgi:hypothetical protein
MYKESSLYGATSIIDGELDILNYRKIPSVASDVPYVIKPQYNYRPDLLASDLYEDPNLWWVFKSRNPNELEDPIFDFVAGVEIKIPKLDTIKRILGV